MAVRISSSNHNMQIESIVTHTHNTHMWMCVLFRMKWFVCNFICAEKWKFNNATWCSHRCRRFCYHLLQLFHRILLLLLLWLIWFCFFPICSYTSKCIAYIIYVVCRCRLSSQFQVVSSTVMWFFSAHKIPSGNKLPHKCEYVCMLVDSLLLSATLFFNNTATKNTTFPRKSDRNSN